MGDGPMGPLAVGGGSGGGDGGDDGQVHIGAVAAGAAGPGPVLQCGHPLGGEPLAPAPHSVQIQAKRAGDSRVRVTLRIGQCGPGPLHPAQRSSPRTRQLLQ